tara:strand:- start:577 stop:2784 length:2208 start_codon:yes stop_codon:yes gene_type:complete
MAIFKSLSPDDVSRVPFNANKQFTFNSSSAATVGFTIERFEYTSSILDTFSSSSTDSKNIIKYYQLDHLFYKNNQLDIANRLGDADYLAGNRTLYDKVNVISIPSNLYGNKIKPGTFIYSSSNGTIIDDSKGNLLISGTNLINHSIDEREKVFNLGPTKGFKQYNLNYDLYGKDSPNKLDSYTKENIYDDSYYNNTLNYKNISFKSENLSPDLLSEYGFQTIFHDNTTGWTTEGAITSDFSVTGGVKLSVAGNGTTGLQFKAAFTNKILKAFKKYRLEFNITDINSFTSTGKVKSSILLDGNNAYEPYGNPTVKEGKTIIEFQYIPMAPNAPSTLPEYTDQQALNFPDLGKPIILFEFTNGDTEAFDMTIKDISFKEIMDFPTVNFVSSDSSSIVAPHNETYNFNSGEDFTIAMNINPTSGSGYLLSKSTTKTILKTPINEQTYTTGSSQPFNVKSKIQYPFEIFIDSSNLLTFRKSDGNFTPTVTAPIATGSLHHVVCMSSASKMEIWITGSKIASTTDTTVSQTENQANLYVGSKGETSNYYTGSLANVMIFNSSRTPAQIDNLYSSSNGSPYVGNVFYSNGLATITHPNHLSIAQPFESGSVNIENALLLKRKNLDEINNSAVLKSFFNLPFSGSSAYTINLTNIHPIYENEYMCTINSDEYNFTHNISTRKNKSDQKPDLANFATGSQFKPYVTTVGLYNEANELLVIGKLGQPVRMSEESDTTFALRWDT